MARVDCKDNDGPLRIHRPYRESGVLSDAEIRLELQSDTEGPSRSCRLSRARAVEEGGDLTVMRPLMIYLSKAVGGSVRSVAAAGDW